MRPPKFNFIPERQLIQTYQAKDPFFTASIYPNGQLNFNSDYITVHEIDKKFTQFYLDQEKRTIGWRLIVGDTSLEELSDLRQLNLKPSGKGMSVKISILPLLHLLGWEKGISFKKMPIKVYKVDSQEIHYVELPDKIINSGIEIID